MLSFKETNMSYLDKVSWSLGIGTIHAAKLKYRPGYYVHLGNRTYRRIDPIDVFELITENIDANI